MAVSGGILLDGLVFPEGPRWHDGKLWLSDMHAHRIITVDLAGRAETVAELDDKPSGLGFLPDGRVLAVSMRKRLIVSLADGGYRTYADLESIPGESINDMVVDGVGRAYVSNRTMSRSAGAPKKNAEKAPDDLILVSPDGTMRVVAEGMWRPNGLAVTPDGRTLIVAESLDKRLTAFTIQADGSLTDRRTFAVLASLPDGICLDAEGGVWAGQPLISEFVRVVEGGEVTERHQVSTGRWAVACVLGGPHRRTLFMATADQTFENLDRLVSFDADLTSTSKGYVEVASVAVAGAGWP
jgi:sugar lactone lactonase YvrE